MGEKLFQLARNALLVMILILLIGALGGAGWYYYDSFRSPASAPGRSSGLSGARVAAPGSTRSNFEANSRVAVRITAQPADQFREDVKDALIKELVAIYPQVSAVSWRSDGQDPAYQDSVFKFLSSAENAASAQQPPMLLAADFMLDPVACSEASKDKCDQLRGQFAGHRLNFPASQSAGAFVYRHDLLWRIWKEYPSSEWGERAFILLLLTGWDTTGSCAKGVDQLREVVRQGDSFLQQHTASPNRALVANLVGQAYAAWWSRSMLADTGPNGYTDPQLFTEGAEQARLRSISYFEKVLELSPRGSLADYSRQVLPPLQNRQLISMSYPFVCFNKE